MKTVLKIEKISILRDHFEGRSAITALFHDVGISARIMDDIVSDVHGMGSFARTMDDFAGDVHDMGSFARTMDDSIAGFHDIARSYLFRGIILLRFP